MATSWVLAKAAAIVAPLLPIALLLFEGVIGRDLSLGIKERIVQVGFVFLILLMGFVIINDLTKILK